MPDSIQLTGRSAPEKAAGLQRPSPTSPARASMPATGWAAPRSLWVWLAARRRRHLQAQALQNLPRDGLPVPHAPASAWGVRVSGSADDESFYKRTNETGAPPRPPAHGWASRSTRRSQLLEVFTPIPTTPAGAASRCGRPAPPSPPTPGRLSSASSGAAVPGKPAGGRPLPPGAGPALRRRPQRHRHRSTRAAGGQLQLWCMTGLTPAGSAAATHQLWCLMDMFRNGEGFCRRRQPEDAPLLPTSCSRDFIQRWRWATIQAALRGRAGRSRAGSANCPGQRLHVSFTPTARADFSFYRPLRYTFSWAVARKCRGIDPCAPQVAAILGCQDSMELFRPVPGAGCLTAPELGQAGAAHYKCHQLTFPGPRRRLPLRGHRVWHCGRAVTHRREGPVQSVRLECANPQSHPDRRSTPQSCAA